MLSIEDGLTLHNMGSPDKPRHASHLKRRALTMLKFLHRLISKPERHQPEALETPADNEPLSPISVACDKNGVRLSFEGQVKQEVAWDKIDLIAIRIEDEFLPFPYWYVGNKDNLLRIPNDATGGKELFFDGFSEHISGYNSDTTFKVIIEASAATEGSFVVWRAAAND